MTHELAALAYLAAAVMGWRALRRGPRSGRGRGSRAPRIWLLLAGVLMHAWGFVSLHGQDPPVPLSSFPAAVSLIGWLLPVSFLLALRVAHVREVGAWVAGLAAVLTGIAALGLRFGSIEAAPGDAGGALSHAHVLLSTLGFSLLGLASMAGLAFLAKERALKGKSASRIALPSLESLDRIVLSTLALGFPLLTLGVVTGFVWGGASPWTGHALWLLAAWTVYLIPVGMLVLRRQHGDRPARGAVLGFALLAFSYIGIRLLEGAG